MAKKRMVKKTKLNTIYDRYDLVVRKNHNFIANGVVVHNTSAHIAWKDNNVRFFSGEQHERFVTIFDEDKLRTNFEEMGCEEVILYGEAYGGKCQGQSHKFGKEFKFIVFDVKIGDMWLTVPKAEKVAHDFGLEFVDYDKVVTSVEILDQLRDKESTQAIRNGMGHGHNREGVVLRPLIEVTLNNGKRVIAKHKRDDERETKTKREVSPEQLKVLADAKEVANEWVTDNRLTHVLQQLPEGANIENMGDVIKTMIADVKREGEGEIVWSKPVEKEIGKETALMFKRRLQSQIGKE